MDTMIRVTHRGMYVRKIVIQKTKCTILIHSLTHSPHRVGP